MLAVGRLVSGGQGVRWLVDITSACYGLLEAWVA